VVSGAHCCTAVGSIPPPKVRTAMAGTGRSVGCTAATVRSAPVRNCGPSTAGGSTPPPEVRLAMAGIGGRAGCASASVRSGRGGDSRFLFLLPGDMMVMRSKTLSSRQFSVQKEGKTMSDDTINDRLA